MEATAISIGKSVLSGALNYAQSAVAEEVALQLGVQRDHSFITDELEMMQGFLMAARDEQDDNKVVKIWVKQVRDVSYVVEDCLVDFAVRFEKQSWWCLSPAGLDRRHVAKQMKELRAKVEEVSQRNLRYHLIKGSSSKSISGVGQPTIASATTSAADDARLLWHKAKMDLVKLINCKDDALRVIALWDTDSSDLGEKSIIKSAYEDPKIQKNFDCRAWITLTCPFNQTDFIRSIVRQIYSNSLEDTREEGTTTIGAQVLKVMATAKDDGLAYEFMRYFNDKSYLVVLNDIHTIEEWDCIRTCFPENKKGSRIIVSSEQVDVARLCIGEEDEGLVHKKLFADPSLYVFYKKGGRNSMEIESISCTTTTHFDSSAHKNICTHTSAMAILEESRLIGREYEKEKIIKIISDKDLQFHVISLWGMGGVGKTTLVRDIYQSIEITSMFDKLAFVTIMRPINPATLLASLAMQFGGNNETDLGRCLEGRRYLLVLDDLWSIVEWDAIKQYFPETAASCIIVTTREENIAKHCSKDERNMYKLNHLSCNDACSLFTKKVFKKTVDLDEQYPELVEPAQLILKKCGGLPLALIIIGGFLANQPKTAFEWRKLDGHISAEMEMNPELELIKVVMKAVFMKIYDVLPYHLKACFLYLAIFPEDHMIARRRLVCRWIAEGYPSEERGKSVEEVLDCYFMELISRGMILPSQQSIYSRKGIDSCHVHDLIREIAFSDSVEENLVFTLEEGCSLNNQGIVRHLAVRSNWKGDQCEFENIVDLSRIRSLTVFGEWKPFFISDKMRLVRVLDLEDTRGLVDHHLEHIGKLVHLRYLSLRGHAAIFHLPNSLGNLRQLQTLDISGTSIIKLPRTITKLVKMQRILASDIGKTNSDIFEDADEQSLRSLPFYSVACCVACCAPNGLGEEAGLVDGTQFNRRDICTAFCCSILPYYAAGRSRGGVEVSRGIWKLKALHTLRTVDVSVGKHVLKDIKRLTRLRKLGVTGINKRNVEEFCSAIACLSRLESLSLWSVGHVGLSIYLDRLTSLPENLQSLKLYGNLVKLPEPIRGLKNLVKLKLAWSRISELDVSIQVLGNLPNLATLCLLEGSFVFEEVRFSFYGEAFPSLKLLQLRSIADLKLVEFEEGAAPKLELLQYLGGRSSTSIGLFSGLAYLPSLKEFMLEKSDWETELVEHLRGQLAENRNRPVLKSWSVWD